MPNRKPAATEKETKARTFRLYAKCGSPYRINDALTVPAGDAEKGGMTVAEDQIAAAVLDELRSHKWIGVEEVKA